MVAGVHSDAAGGVLLVPSDFHPGPGVELTQSLTVGKLLGSGMQVRSWSATPPLPQR